ncbi:MAG: MarR family transcriptional regulator [Saprospiraceae bacterium]|nr:MarR family transcriptional regulator [Saprospiraceae bacterium]
MSARTVYLIKRIETEVTAQMNRALMDFDITLAQFIVLNFVNDHTHDLSSAQLSRRFNMTPQSMNEVVTTLQRKGLIEKKSNSDNKRVLLIGLTPKGVEVLTKCNEAIDTVESELFRPFSEKELTQYRNLIGKLLAHVRTNENNL